MQNNNFEYCRFDIGETSLTEILSLISMLGIEVVIVCSLELGKAQVEGDAGGGRSSGKYQYHRT